MIDLLSFLLAAYLGIIIHELGHFGAARHLNAIVEEVNFGYGKVLYTLMYKGVPFKFSVLPIYGLVKAQVSWDETTQSNKTILLYSAGIAANFLVAIVSFALLLLLFQVAFIPNAVTTFIFYISLFNLGAAIANLLPYTLFNQTTDGKVIYDIIKSRRQI